MKQRQAFSMIEILAVLTIIALITAMLSIRWSHTYGQVKFDSVVQQIVDFDAKARASAVRKNRSGELTIDLEQQSMRRTCWNNDRASEMKFNLPTGLRLSQFMTLSGTESDGVYRFLVDPDGSTMTYGVSLNQDDKRRSIVFSGRAGQAHIFESEEDVEEIFNRLQVEGIDLN